MSTQSLEQLVETWMQGWATARSYEPRRAGRAVVVRRPDKDGLVEKIAVCSGHDELRSAAADLDGVDRLTVVTEDPVGIRAAAEGLGLEALPDPEMLMTTDIRQHDVEPPLRPGDGVEYSLDRPTEGVVRATVTVDGEPAAHGTASIVGEVAVFDTIRTEEKFRRRGLGSFIMRVLTFAAQDDDIETGLLFASPDGRHLYQYLGWDELASIVMFEPGRT